jgi:molecular chaperone GrpE (heat shock protein)
LRNRNDRRRRELIDTWQARYDKLDTELDWIKKIGGVAAVTAGVTIFALMRRGKGSGGGFSMVELQKAKTALEAEASFIKHSAARDVNEAKSKAVKGLSSDLLQVVDDLNNAVKAAENESAMTISSMRDGVSLVEGNLLNVLKNHGIKRIVVEKGMDFDPTVHEAVFTDPITNEEEQKKNTISNVQQEGYLLNEIVLRASRVGVYKDQ